MDCHSETLLRQDLVSVQSVLSLQHGSQLERDAFLLRHGKPPSFFNVDRQEAPSRHRTESPQPQLEKEVLGFVSLG